MELPEELSETAKHAGLIHKLVRAFDTAELEPRDLNRLAEDADRCRQLYGVMCGWMEMKSVKFKIDCDSVPEWGWSGIHWQIEKHQRQGQVVLTRLGENLYINDRKIGFHFFETQPSETGGIDQYALEAELRGKDMLNANVMLFLSCNRQLIPEQWRWIGNPQREYHKSLPIRFWGTLIRHNTQGHRCIPQLYCIHPKEGLWKDSLSWMSENHYSPGVAAVLEAA